MLTTIETGPEMMAAVDTTNTNDLASSFAAITPPPSLTRDEVHMYARKASGEVLDQAGPATAHNINSNANTHSNNSNMSVLAGTRGECGRGRATTTRNMNRGSTTCSDPTAEKSRHITTQAVVMIPEVTNTTTARFPPGHGHDIETTYMSQLSERTRTFQAQWANEHGPDDDDEWAHVPNVNTAGELMDVINYARLLDYIMEERHR